MPYEAITLLHRHINIFEQTEAPASAGSRLLQCLIPLQNLFKISFLFLSPILLQGWGLPGKGCPLITHCALLMQASRLLARLPAALVPGVLWGGLTPLLFLVGAPGSLGQDPTLHCTWATSQHQLVSQNRFHLLLQFFFKSERACRKQSILHPSLFIHTCNFNDLKKQNRQDLKIKVLCA